MKQLILAIAAFVGPVLITGKIWAQEDEKPVPKAPYIADVPEYGHWIVTFKYPKDPAADKPGAPKPPAAQDGFPVSIETIRTGDLRGVTLTFAGGKTKEFTCEGDWVLSSTSKGAQLSMASPSRPPYVYYTSGFVFLDGTTINASTFRQAEEHNGVMSFHYKSGDVDVWIDPQTMHPLGAKENDVEVAYQFLTPPPRPFPIPKDQAALMKKAEDANRAVRSLQ